MNTNIKNKGRTIHRYHRDANTWRQVFEELKQDPDTVNVNWRHPVLILTIVGSLIVLGGLV